MNRLSKRAVLVGFCLFLSVDVQSADGRVVPEELVRLPGLFGRSGI